MLLTIARLAIAAFFAMILLCLWGLMNMAWFSSERMRRRLFWRIRARRYWRAHPFGPVPEWEKEARRG